MRCVGYGRLDSTLEDPVSGYNSSVSQDCLTISQCNVSRDTTASDEVISKLETWQTTFCKSGHFWLVDNPSIFLSFYSRNSLFGAYPGIPLCKDSISVPLD